MCKVDVSLNVVDCAQKFEPLAAHEEFSGVLGELELVYLDGVSHSCS